MSTSIYQMPNRVQWGTRIGRNTAIWKGRLIRANQYVSPVSSTHTSPYAAQTLHFKRVVFTVKSLTRVYDEFDHRYYNDGDATGLREIPFQEIPALFWTHDIGDGENDYLGDKVILDAQIDSKHYNGYNHRS